MGGNHIETAPGAFTRSPVRSPGPSLLTGARPGPGSTSWIRSPQAGGTFSPSLGRSGATLGHWTRWKRAARGSYLVLSLVWLGSGSTWAHEERIVNLKQAPPDQQVEAVEYCRGQYRVRLKDGTSHEFREVDLHFKTNSGPNGPRLGTPALIPAGMRGDRAVLIFSRPDEMKVFLNETC